MGFTIESLVQASLWDHYTYAYDWDGSTPSNLIYVGRAAIGYADKANAVWQIMKFTYSGSNMIDKQWADNGSFLNVWDNRASATYS